MSFQRTKLGQEYHLRQNSMSRTSLVLERGSDEWSGVGVPLENAKALYASLGAWLREVDPEFQEAESGPAESPSGLAQEVADLKARVEKLEQGQVKVEGDVLTPADDYGLSLGSVVRDADWDEWIKGAHGWRMKGLTYDVNEGRTLAHVIESYGPVVLVERK